MTTPIPSPRPASATAMPRFVSDLATSVLMGIGAVYVRQGLVSGQAETAIVGGLVAGLSVTWSCVMARLAKPGPGVIRWISATVSQAGAPNVDAYDQAIAGARAAIGELVKAEIDRQIAARAGILTRPAEAIADRAAAEALDEGARALTIPHMSTR